MVLLGLDGLHRIQICISSAVSCCSVAEAWRGSLVVHSPYVINVLLLSINKLQLHQHPLHVVELRCHDSLFSLQGCDLIYHLLLLLLKLLDLSESTLQRLLQRLNGLVVLLLHVIVQFQISCWLTLNIVIPMQYHSSTCIELISWHHLATGCRKVILHPLVSFYESWSMLKAEIGFVLFIASVVLKLSHVLWLVICIEFIANLDVVHLNVFILGSRVVAAILRVSLPGSVCFHVILRISNKLLSFTVPLSHTNLLLLILLIT